MDSLQEQRSMRLRQRLWGAAVLIALLVIFLPLLLDGSGSESEYRRVERLREEPPRIVNSNGETEATAESLNNAPVVRVNSSSEQTGQAGQGNQSGQNQQSVQGQDRQGVQGQGGQDGNGAQAQGGQDGQGAQGQNAQNGQGTQDQGLQNGQGTQGQDGQDGQDGQVAQGQDGQAGQNGQIDRGEQNAQSDLPTDEGETIDTDSASQARPDDNESTNSEQVSAWVVQAGSFAAEDNALAVRDRLRAAGYPSFVTPTETDPPVYRVRVGPMIDLKQAESKRDEVIDYLGREAIVVSYP